MMGRRTTLRTERAVGAGVPDLEYNLSMEQALAMQVRISWRGAKATLGEVAEKHPLLLERLMDRTPPGTPLFWAISLVYEQYETKVRPVVEAHNAVVREQVVAHLPRPVLRLRLTREALNALNRLN